MHSVIVSYMDIWSPYNEKNDEFALKRELNITFIEKSGKEICVVIKSIKGNVSRVVT